MRGLSASVACLILASCVSPPAYAELHKEFSGYVAMEPRFFWEDNLASGQRGDFDFSLVLQPEFYLEWDKGDQSITFVPFVRWDQHDNERTHWDIRELFWLKAWEDWEVSAGIRKVFWGVTESQHLVDVINQTDLVENLDTEDKLGQPMVKVAWIQDWGTLETYLMPYFRERTFPGRKGRLRPIPIVDADNAVYESGAKETHFDWALRYSHTVGMFDIGLAHFMGTSREPRLELGTDSFGTSARIPFYDVINQTSLDLQMTAGDWLWKLEGISREGFGASYRAVVGGFEYTIVGVFDTVADLGLLTEYHFDERGDKATSSFDNDVFGAFRLTLNDFQSTELLAGATVDLETQAVSVSVEGSRRLTDHMKLSLEVRILSNFPGTDPSTAAHQDDYAQLELSYYF